MTRDEIMALTPEMLRVEIAKAKGAKLANDILGNAVYQVAGDWKPVPNYPADIAAAWELLQNVMETDPYWCPDVYWDDDDGMGNPCWVCTFHYYGEHETDYKEVDGFAPTAPLAISRAWLVWKQEAE